MEVAALGLRVDGVENINQASTALASLGKASESAQKKVGDGSRANKQYADSAKSVKPPTDMAAKSIKDLASASDSSSVAVTALSRAAYRFGGIVGAALGINAVRKYADTWSDLSSVVGASTGDMDGAAASMARLTEIANASYSTIEQTAQGYASNVGILRDLGKSAAEAADYTESLNHMLVLTATRGERAASVQNALSKAMAVGRLQADGLETILANGGEVAQALANELKTTVSGLRAASTEGRITGEVIANAIIKPLDQVRERAGLMPATVTDAFVRVNNNLLAFVGTADKATGASSAFAEAVLGLADHISALTNSTKFMDGLATAAQYAGTAVKALAIAAGVVLVARLGAATIAMVANTAATVANAAAMGRAGVAAMAASAANTTLAATATAAGRALALVGGPVGAVVGVFATFAVAIADFGGAAKKAAEQTDLLQTAIEGMSKTAAESLQFKLKEQLEDVDKAADDAAAMLRGAQKDYEALKAAFEQGRGIDAKGLANAAEGVRQADLDLVAATQKAESFRAKLAEVAQYLANIGNQGPVAAAGVDKFKAATEKWLKEYATQGERLEATLARAREEGGGRIDPEVERRIRASFATKRGGGGASRDPAGADYIRQLNERIALIGKETEYEQLLARIRSGSIKFATKAMEDQALAQAQVLDLVKEQEEAYKRIDEQRQKFAEKGADSFILGSPAPLSGGEFDSQVERYDAEQQAELERYAQVQKNLIEARENRYNTNRSYDELEEIAAQQHSDRMAQIDKARTTVALSAAGQMFGSVTAIMRAAGKEQSGIYKAMFLAEKAVAIAQAIISTQLGAAKALGMGPLGIPLATYIKAAGYASVGLIAAQTIQGMAHDGMDSVPETGTWLLQKGERVTTAQTSARLDSVLDRIESRQTSGVVSKQRSGMVVNLIENPERAGQAEVRENEFGDEEADIFVADIFGGGKRAEALQTAYGLQRIGS